MSPAKMAKLRCNLGWGHGGRRSDGEQRNHTLGGEHDSLGGRGSFEEQCGLMLALL